VRLRAAVASLALVAAVAVALGGGCDGGLVHTFGAFPFNVAQGCLEGATAVDVIEGPDPGACNEVHCWVKPSGDILVTDQACDAPTDYTESASGPCKQALDAYKKRVMCSDAGSGAGGGGGGS
jgi:hypothetical protein